MIKKIKYFLLRLKTKLPSNKIKLKFYPSTHLIHVLRRRKGEEGEEGVCE